MSEKIAVHALWAGAVMYCVGVLSLAWVSYGREPRGAEAAGAVGVALFGPIVSVVGLVVTARIARRGKTAEPPRDDQR